MMGQAHAASAATNSRPRARWGGGRLLLLIALTGLAIAIAPVFASAGEEPTRPEYVATLEQICKPGTEATQRAVHGIRHDVRSERLRLAASKFSQARRIFAHTVDSISSVPRPEADRRALERWFTALGRERVYLGRIVTVLRAEDVAGFQRVSADFIHQGNRANNVVVSFGFNYCSFKPSRFQ
jgi:hypothetical protein